MQNDSQPLPEKIGIFQIERRLGQGGMGVVFLAYDPICKRHVALKQIRKDLNQNASLQKRFLREALIAANLSHPSIIPIYSIHKEEKTIFYTMPYVEGQTLKQILKISQEEEKEGEINHPIGSSIPALAHIFLKVCQAIAYAHSKGILHRDLKPDNIIVGKYGGVLLFDWGLADLYRNNLKDREFDKEASQNLDPEQMTIADRQGRVEDPNFEIKPTRSKTDSSSCFGIYRDNLKDREFDKEASQNLDPEPMTIAERQGMNSAELTKPGKVPGTLLYLAPEKILGQPSTPQTDIFSLGVILYQILTLHPPFRRKSIDHLRKTLQFETVIDPLEVAPYRDIPQHLADVVKRCLRFNPQERFQSVDEIISEVNSYIEGRPEWIPTAQLSIEEKNDWEFQENVLLAKHMAITRSPHILEWVSLMISRMSFAGNMRLEANIKLAEGGGGIGVLLAIPEASERKGLVEEGYYLWIGSHQEPGLRIFQFNVEVMTLPEPSLNIGTWHQLTIELLNNHLYVYLDDILRCHYISHVPMMGTHVGLLYKDADFTIQPLQISVGSQNAMVNCLAIPDSFLANKNYAKALIEYRRIASSFSGRTEGREALFRAGITLLQQALHQKNLKEKEKLYTSAQEEFSKLRFTPGAPLEFLGKSLIYKAMNDIEEEEKCLELALRKYPKHPLIKVIVEHIIFRLHETSNRNRVAAFHFLLLAAGHLPRIFSIEDNARLLNSLKTYLEPLAFLIPLASDHTNSEERLNIAVQIAFWLAKPLTLMEIAESPLSSFIINNAFLCLLVLNGHEWIRKNTHRCERGETLKIALLADKEGALACLKKILCLPIDDFSLRCAHYLIENALISGNSSQLIPLFDQLSLSIKENKEQFDVLFIWAYLLNDEWKKAQALFESYSPEILANEYCPLYPLMGCWLHHTEGEEIALTHFASSIDLPYPPTTMLLSFYLRGKISEKRGWIATAFSWEKIQLFRQLHLYYHCAEEPHKAKYFLKLMKRELKRVHTQHCYS